MKKIALVSPLRTAVGSFNGTLSTLSATELGSTVIKACLNQSNVNSSFINEVYMGNVLQAGNGQNPARQAAIKAGIPVNVPASTINTVTPSISQRFKARSNNSSLNKSAYTPKRLNSGRSAKI